MLKKLSYFAQFCRNYWLHGKLSILRHTLQPCNDEIGSVLSISFSLDSTFWLGPDIQVKILASELGLQAKIFGGQNLGLI